MAFYLTRNEFPLTFAAILILIKFKKKRIQLNGMCNLRFVHEKKLIKEIIILISIAFYEAPNVPIFLFCAG